MQSYVLHDCLKSMHFNHLSYSLLYSTYKYNIATGMSLHDVLIAYNLSIMVKSIGAVSVQISLFIDAFHLLTITGDTEKPKPPFNFEALYSSEYRSKRPSFKWTSSKSYS